ncbi:endonuclease III [candidate division WWE3 bacterium CG_4_9_14_0_2_um_filter_35_11]|uniref:Endonuclease III n=1 Tax=candidate division WWE3 bacterium CG_4_9_14_0_2_um_filter_35_11 TaxID=1975077 RepID=A0A2M8ELI2_UNCKA|nr:MAG: endonuclease III [candidate division WWE3 bacterium CG10_big_fil_rev_8_21_14_0_10_35_32]PJC23588.1 MAG: endonuclease III [candidate division WWE3 bacterium CG_4_9_14_0_2_um_filter_35_11]
MNIEKLLDLLHKEYTNPKTELENWTTTAQFMVAVILSAQATDKQVNKISNKLFEKYRSVDDFAKADIFELEPLVSSINYYKTKAKRIIDANKFVKENFKGEFPGSIDKLIKIPGIGRKSANVILQEAMGIAQGIVVDTHVTRVSNRLGLVKGEENAEKIEKLLMSQIPGNEWKFFSQSIVLHGRYICKAKKPNCTECILNKECPSAFKV